MTYQTLFIKLSQFQLPNWITGPRKTWIPKWSSGFCNVSEGEDRMHLPKCTHALFRQFYNTSAGAFPECGAWVETQGQGFSQRYVLDFCEFKPYNWPECSRKKRMRHLLMMGDSTGWFLFASMLNTTIWGGSTCRIIRHEGAPSMSSFRPSRAYFSLGRKSLQTPLKARKRGCRNCRAVIYDCKMTTTWGFHNLRLEFAPGYKFQDPSLVLSNGSSEWPPSDTFQEFLFRTYLPLSGMPDGIVIPFPLAHEKFNGKAEDDMKKLLHLVLKFVPRTTAVFWVTDATEVEGKRRDSTTQKYIKKKFGKDQLIAADMIYRLNTRIFRVLQPYMLDKTFNMFGFVNLVNMSATKADWSTDAVHYNYVWCAHVIRIFLSHFCADD